jgi:hypothetical protein
MEESSYKVFKKWVDDINFEILILEIPENELEDKLAFTVRDEINLTKEGYFQYIMFMCIANVQQLAYSVQTSIEDVNEYDKIKEKIVEFIYDINPKLRPENLILNKNSIIKIKKSDELAEGERLLIDNKVWNQPPSKDNEDCNAYKCGASGTQADDSELQFTVEKKWWKKINRYINIKKYDGADLNKIISGKRFYDASTFRTFVVTVCVVDYNDLFAALDDEGISKRIHPQILMREIYELCKEVNPFFSYSRIKDSADEGDGCDTCNVKRVEDFRNRKMGTYTTDPKNAKKLKFRDIPRKDLLCIGDEIKKVVIGQDESIDSMVKAIQRASVGLKDPVKPIGSFLFAGRSGVGKSYSSKVLSEKLTRSNDHLINIDCSEYSSDHEYAKLIGAPSGYVGHEQGGMLTNAVQKNPFSVIVFDEIEKASDKIRELLLQILEEGRLTDGKGKQVSFKDTVVIMTSNIGVSEIDEVASTIGFGDVAKVTDTKKNKAIEKAIKKKFKPEFINRIDAIIYFNNLNKDDYMQIIDLELEKLNKNLKENNTDFKDISLKFDDSVRNIIYKKGIDETYGARPLKRCIEREISDPLAMQLLSDDLAKKGVIRVKCFRGKVMIEWEEFIEEDITLKCNKVNF